MVIRTLCFEQAGITAAAVCSLIAAGLLKGVIGVGMPVVALPLLSPFIDVKSAAMRLTMPLILGDVPQALEGGKTGQCLMQLMPVFLGVIQEAGVDRSHRRGRRFAATWVFLLTGLNVQKSRLNKGGCKCPKATG